MGARCSHGAPPLEPPVASRFHHPAAGKSSPLRPARFRGHHASLDTTGVRGKRASAWSPDNRQQRLSRERIQCHAALAGNRLGAGVSLGR